MRNRFESNIELSWGTLPKVRQARLYKVGNFVRFGPWAVDRAREK